MITLFRLLLVAQLKGLSNARRLLLGPCPPIMTAENPTIFLRPFSIPACFLRCVAIMGVFSRLSRSIRPNPVHSPMAPLHGGGPRLASLTQLTDTRFGRPQPHRISRYFIPGGRFHTIGLGQECPHVVDRRTQPMSAVDLILPSHNLPAIFQVALLLQSISIILPFGAGSPRAPYH